MLKQILMALMLLQIISACSSTRFVEPLNRGESAVSLDLGGPLVKIPNLTTVPIPFSSISIGHGFSNKLTAFASWYPTASVFSVWQFDAGIVRELWYNTEKRMGLTIAPQANFAFDSFENNFRFWPILESNYHWKYKYRFQKQDDLLTGSKQRYNTLFAGINAWFEPNGTKAHDVEQAVRIIPNVHIGHLWRRNKWSFSAEIKILAPFTENKNVVIDYTSILGDRAATGIYLGISKRF
jgi:hypothetical protein